MKTILVGNYKGGVGKTTTTAYLSSYLARTKRVLMIDMDPQSSLSDIAFKNIGKEINDVSMLADNSSNFLNGIYKKSIQAFETNIISFIDFKCKPFTIYNDGDKNKLDFLPNSLFFRNNNVICGLDDLVMEMSDEEKYLFVLPKVFRDSKFYDLYDYVIIDTPPSNNIITQSAFLFADYYIIPTIMDKISEAGVLHYKIKIESLCENYLTSKNNNYMLYNSIFGQKIQFKGILETMRERNSKTNPESSTSLLQFKKLDVFKTFIKDGDSVVNYIYELKKVIQDNKLNIGEGVQHLYSDRPEGYQPFADELLSKL